MKSKLDVPEIASKIDAPEIASKLSAPEMSSKLDNCELIKLSCYDMWLWLTSLSA